MKTHKYYTRPNRRQGVLDASITKFSSGNLTLPLLATSERDRVTAGWWNSVTGAWSGMEQPHTPLVREGASMPRVTAWTWSKRSGVASIGTRMYCAYKRELRPALGGNSVGALWLDVLDRDANTGDFSRLVAMPIQVPLPALGFDRAGFWVHAFGRSGASPRLYLVLQAIVVQQAGRLIGINTGHSRPPWEDPRLWEAASMTGIPYEELLQHRTKSWNPLLPLRLYSLPPLEESHLVILEADLSNPNVDLSASGSWIAHDLGMGGWELDAVLDGFTIGCVHRSTPYALEVAVAATWARGDTADRHFPLSSDLTADGEYPSLELVCIDVSGALTETSRTQVPGGSDPCIQRLNPFILTVDRVIVGEVVVSAPQAALQFGRQSVAARPATASLVPERWAKLLLRQSGAQWGRGQITTMSQMNVPKNIAERFGDSGMIASELIGPAGLGKVGASVLESFQPYVLVNYNPGQPKKGWEQLGFTHHDPRMGTLQLDWFYIIPGAADLSLTRMSALTILDINHGPLGDGLTPDGIENEQFGVLQAGPRTYDTTIGGALSIERPANNLKYYVYTDLGDRGLRVVYDDALPDPAPIAGTVDKSGLTSAQVTGPVGSTDVWQEVAIPDWTPVPYPPYNVKEDCLGTLGTNDLPYPGSLSSGIHVPFDTLLGYLSAAEGHGAPFTIDSSNIDGYQALIDALAPNAGLVLFDVLWGPFDAANAVPDDAPTRYAIPDFRLQIDGYELAYSADLDGGTINKNWVTLSFLPRRLIEIRCNASSGGQGTVDLRFPLRIIAPEIALFGDVADIVTIKNLDVTVNYGRAFTPTILMSETRAVGPLTGTELNPAVEIVTPWVGPADPPASTTTSSILTSKPVGDSYVQAQINSLDVSINLWPAVIATLITILVGLGLGVLVNTAVGVAAVTIVAGIEAVVKKKIEDGIREGILGGLSDSTMRQALDDAALLHYAGEGLGETLSFAALNVAGRPVDVGQQPGRNRIRDQLWQMIFVTAGKFKVLMRV